MRNCLVPIAFALASTGALADTPQPVTAESGHMARLYQRYCDKLKEGPEAYALFVKRMYPITGYWFTEFAPSSRFDTVRHQCRDGGGALALSAPRTGG